MYKKHFRKILKCGRWYGTHLYQLSKVNTTKLNMYKELERFLGKLKMLSMLLYSQIVIIIYNFRKFLKYVYKISKIHYRYRG